MKITPKTFNFIFDDHEKGKKQSSSLLEPIDGLFFCSNYDEKLSFDKVWILDADDTLWEDNIYYEKIALELFEYFYDQKIQIEKEAFINLLNEVEHLVIAKYGFGAEGFCISLREVFDRIKHSLEYEIPEPTGFFENVVARLTQLPKEIPEETLQLLVNIYRNPSEGLLLFTQGPCLIQQGKIFRSGLAPFFNAIAVADNKGTDMYKRVIQNFPYQAKEFLVVGNSLTSEIKPALELGLKAFHYQNANSWSYVNKCDLDDSLYKKISSLTELL